MRGLNARACGMFWPTGAVRWPDGREDNDALLRLVPTFGTIVQNEPDARWQHTVARNRVERVVWRVAPPPSERPAQVGWDGRTAARNAMRNVRFHVEERGGLVPNVIGAFNELSLQYERGDDEDDLDPSRWLDRYRRACEFLLSFRDELRAQFRAERWLAPDVYFPGWAPGHGEWNAEIADVWVPVARTFDGVMAHAYGRWEWIAAEISRYVEAFPSQPIIFDEWNCHGYDGDWIAEERRILSGLHGVCNENPRLRFAYFIYEWVGGARDWYDVRTNDERLATWDGRYAFDETPPETPQEPLPEPEPPLPDPEPVPPEPEPQMPSYDPWEFFSARQIADATDSLVENVEANWPVTVEQLVHCEINSRAVQLGLIATIAVETGPFREHRFTPVREAYWLDVEHGYEWAENWRRENLRYWPHYGRGKIQTTWYDAYLALGPKIAALWRTSPDQPDFDLANNPDLLLRVDLSAAADAIFFRDKRALPSPSYPHGYSLVQACQDRDVEWIRILVQGGTREADGSVVGEHHARQVMDALDAATGAAPEPQPLPNPPTPVYNAHHPAIIQDKSFDCSETALLWIFRAHGRATPSDVWLENAMMTFSPPVMTPELGLTDATGRGLAAFGNYYWGGGDGDDQGYRFASSGDRAVSFDEVAATADGTRGVMFGGRRWYHWACVRFYDRSRDVLILANSAHGHGGVYQEMTRAQFDALGWFSMVTVDVADVGSPPAPEEPPVDEATALRAKNAELAAALDDARWKLGYAAVDVADAFAKAPPKYLASTQAIMTALQEIDRITTSPRVKAQTAAISDHVADVVLTTVGDVEPAIETLRSLKPN